MLRAMGHMHVLWNVLFWRGEALSGVGNVS